MSDSAPAPRLLLADVPQWATPGAVPHELAPADALMLAWLALSGPTPRERLALLLWPDSSPEVARNALRQRLFRLRRECGCDLVEGQATLSLAAGVTHDLDGAGPLLAALQPPSGELGQWLEREREQRRQSQRRRLAARIDALEAGGDLAGALALAQPLLDLDPLSEDAHRRLMRLHYLAGDRSAALRAFDRCERWLKDEVGARPSAETLQLLSTIEQADVAAPPAARRELPAALRRPPRLVGRAVERERLMAVWARGGRLLLTGEAGIGKSRLLQALLGSDDGPLAASGRPGDAMVPYGTLGRLVRELLSRQQPACTPQQRAALSPLVPEWAEPAALGGVRARGAGDVRSRLLQALSQLLAQALPALGGTVLDDLHFADEATLQLLPELMAQCAEAPWILALRPPERDSPAAALVQALSADPQAETLELAPLPPDALAELVDSLALPGLSGGSLASMLSERCGGNPLFALETLKQAWLDGAGADGAELPRPANVGQLIERSLAALSPPALLLARVAAVAGADFSVEMAAHVLNSSPLQLADAWGELESRQVLRGPAFAHDLVHERVLAGVPQVLAQHTHATVAQWLGGHGGEPARVAAHWEAAGQPLKALPALRAAAERAHAALRVPERVALLLRGADIAERGGRDDEAFELVSQAIEAHMNTLRDMAGLPLLDRLDRLARTPRQRAHALGARAWYASSLGEWHDAIDAGQRALALSQAEPDAEHEPGAVRLRASVMQRLGTALAMAGRFDEALPLLHGVQGWVEAHASSDTAAEFHGNLAAVLDNLGRADEAEPHHRRAIAATREQGDHAFLVTALANHALSRLDAGDLRAAGQRLAEAREWINRYALRGSSTGFVASLHALAARSRGDYVEALHWCDEAHGILAAASPGRLPVIALHRAELLLDLAQWARAQQTLQAVDAAALPARFHARHAALHARLRQAMGDPAGAARAMDEALAVAPSSGWPQLRLALRIQRSSWRGDDEALADLADAGASASAMGLKGHALAAMLRAAASARDPEAARRWAAAALAVGDDVVPSGLLVAERWWAPALALSVAGDAAASRDLARRGLDWVEQVAAPRVPATFRDSFLRRQPVVTGLRALAAGRFQAAGAA